MTEAISENMRNRSVAISNRARYLYLHVSDFPEPDSAICKKKSPYDRAVETVACNPTSPRSREPAEQTDTSNTCVARPTTMDFVTSPRVRADIINSDIGACLCCYRNGFWMPYSNQLDANCVWES